MIETEELAVEVETCLRRGRRRSFQRLALLACLCLTSNLLGQDATAAQKTGVCSTTQIADFARQVVGDDWVVQGVLDPGSEPHMYETSPEDIRMIGQSDLCLANGLHLEGGDWMAAAAKEAGKTLVNCTDGIEPLKIEETVDGEQVFVADPHAWFTPSNAGVYVRNILRAVSQLDPNNAPRFNARAKLYLSQLRSLDGWIRQQVNVLPRDRRILVTSHDAFGYFCQAYGFQSAAPEGWSTGYEVGGGATPERRRETVKSIQQFNVKAIFVETSVNPALIKAIAADAGVIVGGQLYSDSMGAAGTAGETYLGMMRENVIKIVTALQ